MNENYPFPNSVMLTCKDMKKTLNFYRNTLGFTLRECWPDENNPAWANLVLDKQSVMLGQYVTGEDFEQQCGHADAETKKIFTQLNQEYSENKPGVGVCLYFAVSDVDTFYKKVTSKGATTMNSPKSQFYGIRDFLIADPDGFLLTFYTPIKLSECQSCGMPLKDAQPGQMYCQYCTDEKGHLKPYEIVLEGTIQGYFMGMRNMQRQEAEKAAKEHLSKMPAWVGKQ